MRDRKSSTANRFRIVGHDEIDAIGPHRGGIPRRIDIPNHDPPAAFAQSFHVGFRSDAHPVQKQPPHTAPARPFRRQAAEGDFGRSAAVTREHLRIVRDQPDIPLPEPGSIGRPAIRFRPVRSNRTIHRPQRMPRTSQHRHAARINSRSACSSSESGSAADRAKSPKRGEQSRPRHCRTTSSSLGTPRAAEFVRRQRRHPFARRKLCVRGRRPPRRRMTAGREGRCRKPLRARIGRRQDGRESAFVRAPKTGSALPP